MACIEWVVNFEAGWHHHHARASDDDIAKLVSLEHEVPGTLAQSRWR
jgi:hypothetical protein